MLRKYPQLWQQGLSAGSWQEGVIDTHYQERGPSRRAETGAAGLCMTLAPGVSRVARPLETFLTKVGAAHSSNIPTLLCLWATVPSGHLTVLALILQEVHSHCGLFLKLTQH